MKCTVSWLAGITLNSGEGSHIAQSELPCVHRTKTWCTHAPSCVHSSYIVTNLPSFTSLCSPIVLGVTKSTGISKTQALKNHELPRKERLGSLSKVTSPVWYPHPLKRQQEQCICSNKCSEQPDHSIQPCNVLQTRYIGQISHTAFMKEQIKHTLKSKIFWFVHTPLCSGRWGVVTHSLDCDRSPRFRFQEAHKCSSWASAMRFFSLGTASLILAITCK
jgi:hypothetical protein